MDEKGYLMLVLHQHLPFIKHPEYPDFLEERWFYEGVTETYLPLLNYFEQLRNENVNFKITLSLSPSLADMFDDPLLQDRTLNFLENLVKLGEKELKRTRGDERYYFTALHYHNKFLEQLDIFVNKYHKNLLNAYRSFLGSGHIDIITCTGPHIYTPNFIPDPGSIRAAIRASKKNFVKHFNKEPQGIWLAENGYYVGCDEFLVDENLRYFFLETHGIAFGDPRPVYGVFAPVYTPAGAAVFARDVESAKQVWSADEGYPGDFDYREFYRDIGFELPLDYLADFMPGNDLRVQTGFKYNRITGRTDFKEPYNREAAENKAAEHAGNFLFNRAKQVEHLAMRMDRQPVVVSMYDAELFGHWWYEGPEFIYYLIKKINYDQNVISLISPVDYLRKYPVNQVVTPNSSSWGYKGYSEVWLNGNNEWVLYYIHDAAGKMAQIAKEKYNSNPDEQRVLNQMAREILLAQGSDWPFIMTTGTTVDYAVKRVREHIHNFNKFYYELKENDVDMEFLHECEIKNSIFQEIDYRIYA